MELELAANAPRLAGGNQYISITVYGKKRHTDVPTLFQLLGVMDG